MAVPVSAPTNDFLSPSNSAVVRPGKCGRACGTGWPRSGASAGCRARLLNRPGQAPWADQKPSLLCECPQDEVHSDRLVRRKIKSAISKRGFNSFAAFFHRNIGQSHNIEISLVARPDVHLDFHEVVINAKHCGSKCFEEHSKGRGTRERSAFALCSAAQKSK